MKVRSHEKNNYENMVLWNTKNYIETYFCIKSKDREIIPFILNPIQDDYLRNRSHIGIPGRGQRDLIFKARQHGFTTLKCGEFLHDTITNEGVNTVIVGHDEDAVEKILDNTKLMYNSIPEIDRPILKYDNRGEMFFPGLNSRMFISTYRMLKLRSQTISNLLMTEVAFWKMRDLGDYVAGMTEAVPFDGNIAFESSPNGIGGLFWDMVQSAKKDESIYKLFVYPWFVNPEYSLSVDKWHLLPEIIRPSKNDLKLDKVESNLMERFGLDLDQIMWRRFKMLSLSDMRIDSKGNRTSRRFAQEYGCSFLSSGNAVFDSSYLVPSVHFRAPDKSRKFIHGADTAEGVQGGNYNVLYTMDFETGEVVNKIRGLWKPAEFALRVHKIGMEYGGLIGVENNNTGHAVLLKLSELFEVEAVKLEGEAIENARKNPDDEPLQAEARKDKYDRMPYRIYSEKKRLGWSTGELNRKMMFVEGEEALKNGYIKLAIEDEEGIEELIACQYDERMKEKAPEGMHDDSIMALLIAFQMRKYWQFYFRGDSGGVKARVY